jgi:hypothetical protein
MPIDVQSVPGEQLDETRSRGTKTEHILYALGLGVGVGVVKNAKVAISS